VIKKYICLFLAETCWFDASATAAVLSTKIVVASNFVSFSDHVSLVDISQNNLRIQVVCFVQSNKAIYFNSAEEVAIIICFCVLQTIGVPLMAII